MKSERLGNKTRWSVCVVCFVLIGEAGRTSDCSQQCDRRGKPGPGPTQTPSSHIVRRRLRPRTCRFDRLRCIHSDGNMIWDWYWHVLKSCLFFFFFCPDGGTKTASSENLSTVIRKPRSVSAPVESTGIASLKKDCQGHDTLRWLSVIVYSTQTHLLIM